MLAAITTLLLVLGIVLLITGFNRNDRKMLVLAGLLLMVGAGGSDFLHGFIDGLHTVPKA
jgi:hypothetical protein